jgi:uncharacterized protein YcaQ
MAGRSALPVLAACAARALFMQAQGLLDDPRRTAGVASLGRLIDRLGYVQVDSINVVDRGHHLTLAARLHGYRPGHLSQLLEQRRSLFEHWTHDASVIPSRWYAHWKPRFRRFDQSSSYRRWIETRMGPDHAKTVAHVKRRLRREGPLMSKAFEAPEGVKRGKWWGWTPQKAALELLWRTGAVTIAGRENFHKIYDLSERVLPELVGIRTPGKRQQLEWACGEAIERLVVASSGEIAEFFAAVTPREAAAWCRKAEGQGKIVAVEVEDARGGRRRAGYALPDWQSRLARCPAAPAGLRLLSPFDPVIRDRRRLERRFGFEYRFEAFVPSARRKWGYYVLPILEGDRFVGRLDPKLHRDRETLEVRHLYWEPGIRPTRARKRALEEALSVLGSRVGATALELPGR